MVLCLLISGISHFISPAEYPLIGVFGLFLPLFLLVNIGFIVWWVLLRKLYFMISFLALFFFLNRLPDIIHLQSDKIPSAFENKTIKILSYNVRLFGLYDWKRNSLIRDSIFDFIRSESPQIACFQEYYNQNDSVFPVHDSLIRHQQFKHTHIHYTSIQRNSHMFGIATYSIYPIINKGVITFQNTTNLAIYSDLIIGNDTIRVFNCHLESLRFSRNDLKVIDQFETSDKNGLSDGIESVIRRLFHGFKRRSAQADEISLQIATSPYPVILCGDFNDTPSSYVYYTLQKGLEDSHRQSGEGLGLTYNRIFTGFRIDYILFSNHFKCLNFKVAKVDYSDHRPVIGNYIIK